MEARRPRRAGASAVKVACRELIEGNWSAGGLVGEIGIGCAEVRLRGGIAAPPVYLLMPAKVSASRATRKRA